jgi:hypothetical protein
MPTVRYKCPDTGMMKERTFPPNAVGRPQAIEFAKMRDGKITMNPGYGMEKSMGY